MGRGNHRTGSRSADCVAESKRQGSVAGACVRLYKRGGRPQNPLPSRECRGSVPARIAYFLVCMLISSLALAAKDEYDCIAEARQIVDIRSPVEGLIEKVSVDRADPIP